MNYQKLFDVSVMIFWFSVSFTIGNALGGIGDIPLNDPQYARFFGIQATLYVLKAIDAIDIYVGLASFIVTVVAYFKK